MATADGRTAAPGAIRVENPAESARVFQDAFNAGDLDGMVSLYESEAVFVPAPGQVTAGSDSIREVLAGFLAVKGRFELKSKSLQQVGDIALETAEWTLEGTDPDGNPVSLAGLATVVLRRQADGSWLMVIDNPFPFE